MQYILSGVGCQSSGAPIEARHFRLLVCGIRYQFGRPDGFYPTKESKSRVFFHKESESRRPDGPVETRLRVPPPFPTSAWPLERA